MLTRDRNKTDVVFAAHCIRIAANRRLRHRLMLMESRAVSLDIGQRLTAAPWPSFAVPFPAVLREYMRASQMRELYE